MKKYYIAGIGISGIFILLTILSILAAFILLCVLPVGGQIWYNQEYCQTQARLMPDRKFQWELFGGCLVKTDDGTWALADRYLNKRQLELEGDLIK